MENKLKNNEFDPFKVLKITEYTYDIENLDHIYYMQYKSQTDKSTVNKAYQILQNPVQKMQFLCKKHIKTDINQAIIAEMLSIFSQKQELNEICIIFFDQSVNCARAQNWQECWHFLQKYQYLSRFLSNAQ